MPQRRSLRQMARRLRARGDGARHLAADDRDHRAISHLRPAHREYRSRSARVHSDIPGILRSHGRRLPHSTRGGLDQDLRPSVRTDRPAIRRAGAGDRGVLGFGERLRRQYGQLPFAEFDRFARLRLSSRGSLSRSASRRLAAHPARRFASAGNDRLVGRRARPDADDAVGIFSIRRRL